MSRTGEALAMVVASSSDWAQVAVAGVGLLVAALVAFMPYARRPKLSLSEAPANTQSHVETTAFGRVPYLRLLAGNAKRRRAAQGTRVIVEWYRPRAGPVVTETTLGHPSLAWPSAPEAGDTKSVVVFAGGFRPVGLASFVRVRRDARGVILRKTEQVDGETIGPYPHYESDPGKPRSVGWYLWVDIGMDLADNRDKLPPVEGGYVIRLVIGADDGAAVAYNVHVDWEGDPDLGPEAVLASALEHLAVTRVR